MQTLIITNPESVDFLTKKVKSDFLLISEGTDKRIKNKYLDDKSLAIIQNQDEFDKFDFAKFKPEVILVVPELLWSKEGIDEGYEIATEILTNKCKKAFLQLIFLSVVKVEDILRILGKQSKNRSLAEAFPHIDLLDENQKIIFRMYSEVHFQLIKSLLLSNSGRLDMLDHNLQPMLANILKVENENIQLHKQNLIAQLEELELFQAWTDIRIINEIKNLNKAETNTVWNDIAGKISKAISEIKLRMPDEDGSLKNAKENYKLMFIEDEILYRELFAEIFSAYFNKVSPDQYDKIELLPQYDSKLKSKIVSFKIEDAKEIVKTQAKHYNVFVLDLLYKDKNGRLLDFNGLDIYLLVKEYNPYAVIRIVTSLPREVIGKVINLTINQDIPLSHVFSKKHGSEALKMNLTDRIEEIVADCKEMERQKNTFLPIPKNGVFKWDGIRDYMRTITYDNPEVFENCLDQAKKLFNLYLEGKLTKDMWKSGELPAPKMESNVTPSYFLDKLSNILIHRMMVLNYLYNSQDYKFISYEDYLLDVIKPITKRAKIDKGYFYLIGFGGTDKFDFEKPSFELNLKQLFPHELDITSKKEKELFETTTLSKYPELEKWVEDVFLNSTYIKAVWRELNLDFDWFKKGHTVIDVTLYQLQLILKQIYELYNPKNKIIQKIVDHLFENIPDAKLDKEIDKIPHLKAAFNTLYDEL
jgi:uncharacterized protein YjfI (DUF2170 family)